MIITTITKVRTGSACRNLVLKIGEIDSDIVFMTERQLILGNLKTEISSSISHLTSLKMTINTSRMSNNKGMIGILNVKTNNNNRL